MKSVLQLMIKVLAIPFYKSHAGLLFFVFLLMFGVVESSQLIYYHQSLIYGMLTSTIFMLIVLMIWLLYQIKALHFLSKTLRKDSYQFIHHLATIPTTQSFILFFTISFIIFLPVFMYTIGIYAIAIQNKFYGNLSIIFLFQVSLWSMNAIALNYLIRNTHKSSAITLPTFTLPYQQTLIGIYAGYLFREEKSAIILSKLFSLTLIYIIKETLEVGDDFRIIGITWLFALLSHSYLINKLKVFEDQYLSWVKNLPIPIIRIFFTYLILYAILLIPELLLLISSIGKGISLIQLLMLPVFASVFLLTIHSYLYKTYRDPDKFVTYLFWLFIICFILILSKAIWLSTVGLLLSSFWLFKKRFFTYEPIIDYFSK